MSGFLKQYDKFVSASVLSGVHNLVLKSNVYKYPLASYYYDPKFRLTGLPKGHHLDVLGLSLVASALTYESVLYAEHLQGDKKQQAAQEIFLNQQLANQCVREAVSLIQAGKWRQQTQASASLIYTTTHSQQLGEEPVENALSDAFYQKHLAPAILNNLNNLSTQNIVDITEGLVHFNYLDGNFWKRFLDHVELNINQFNLSQVEYSGWSTKQFEYNENTCNHASHTQVNVGQLSGTDPVSVAKRLATLAYLEATTRVFQPYIHGETRLKYIFAHRPHQTHVFKASLARLGEKVTGLQSTTARIHKLL